MPASPATHQDEPGSQTAMTKGNSPINIDLALLMRSSSTNSRSEIRDLVSRVRTGSRQNSDTDPADPMSWTRKKTAGKSTRLFQGPQSTQKTSESQRTQHRGSRTSYFDNQPSPLSPFEDIHDRQNRLVGQATDQSPRVALIPKYQKCNACILKIPHVIVYLAIFYSSVQLGMEAEFDNLESCWDVSNHVLTAIFTTEAVSMILYWRLNYFRSAWNSVDCILACLMVVENWALPLLFSQDASKRDRLSFFRIFRLARPLRLVKLLKMKRELCVVVEGIGSSLKSMYWISVLLFVIIYACAIFCVNITARADYSNDKNFNKEEYFGTVLKSMLTLFSMTILAEWSTVIRPISKVQPLIVPFFMLFVTFTSFGIMNVIIGVIVERTTTKAHEKREEDRIRERNEQSEKIETLWDIMAQLDSDGDRRLSTAEMENVAAVDATAKFKEIMAAINLPHGFTPMDLHTMLDLKGTGFLTCNDFIDGMFRLLYCDSFQHTCLVQLTVASLGRQVRTAFGHLLNELVLVVDDMREECSLGAVDEEVEAPDKFVSQSQPCNSTRSEVWSAFHSSEHDAMAACKQSPAVPASPKLPPSSFDYEVLSNKTNEVTHVASRNAQDVVDDWCTTPLQGLRQARQRRRRTIGSIKTSCIKESKSSCSGNRQSVSSLSKLAPAMQVLAEELAQIRMQTTNLIRHFGLDKETPAVAERHTGGFSNKDCALKVGDRVRVIAQGPLSKRTAIVAGIMDSGQVQIVLEVDSPVNLGSNDQSCHLPSSDLELLMPHRYHEGEPHSISQQKYSAYCIDGLVCCGMAQNMSDSWPDVLLDPIEGDRAVPGERKIVLPHARFRRAAEGESVQGASVARKRIVDISFEQGSEFPAKYLSDVSEIDAYARNTQHGDWPVPLDSEVT